MNYHITGKHMELTPSMKEAVHNALDHSKKINDEILDVHVTLTHEHHEYIAEVNLHVAGKIVHVKSQQKNMYDAIADMGEKAVHSLQKAKGKQSRFSHRTLKREYQEEV